MYQQVYFHRTVRAIDLDLAEVFGPSIRAIFGDGSPADRLADYADLDEYALLHQAARWARGEDVAEPPRRARRRTVTPRRRRRRGGRSSCAGRRWRAEAEVRAEYEAGGRPEALDREPRRGRAGPGRDRPRRSSTPGRPTRPRPTACWRSRGATASAPSLVGGARPRSRRTGSSAGATGAADALQRSAGSARRAGGVRTLGRPSAPSRRLRRAAGSTSSGSIRAISARRQLHPLRRRPGRSRTSRLERAEQAVVEVAAGRAAGRALVAEQLAGLDALARLDDDLARSGRRCSGSRCRRR